MAKPIDIKKAKAWTKNWRREKSNTCKAFLIPVDDLLAVLEEMKIIVPLKDGHYQINDRKNAGVRAYGAIDPAVKEGNGEKLLIVGTRIGKDGKHRDLVEGERYAADLATLNGSGVYDFTEPCPNTCDQESPLYDDN